jgi:hypothetical protein
MMGDVLYDVVTRVHIDKDTVTIQLFRAHTSEPFGELQVPKLHIRGLVAQLLPHERFIGDA